MKLIVFVLALVLGAASLVDQTEAWRGGYGYGRGGWGRGWGGYGYGRGYYGGYGLGGYYGYGYPSYYYPYYYYKRDVSQQQTIIPAPVSLKFNVDKSLLSYIAANGSEIDIPVKVIGDEYLSAFHTFAIGVYPRIDNQSTAEALNDSVRFALYPRALDNTEFLNNTILLPNGHAQLISLYYLNAYKDLGFVVGDEQKFNELFAYLRTSTRFEKVFVANNTLEANVIGDLYVEPSIGGGPAPVINA